MTGRQRVVAAMRRNVPDRVPYGVQNGAVPAAIERFKRESGLDDPLASLGGDSRNIFIGFGTVPDYRRYHEGAQGNFRINDWGVRLEMCEGTHLKHIRGSLRGERTDEELADYPLPELLDEREGVRRIKGMVDEAHADGLAANGAVEVGIFEASWQIRGMEGFMVDMGLFPRRAHAFLDRITERCAGMARHFTKAGADVICLSDNVATQRGMMMSLRHWREFFRPRLASVIAETRKVRSDALVRYKCDGDASDIIRDLIEIGVDILTPVQPECMDIAGLKREYGKDLSFWGTVGTQSTLPLATPDEVRRTIRTTIERMGEGGGLYLSPTHILQPDVPWENLVAFVEAAREYGRY